MMMVCMFCLNIHISYFIGTLSLYTVVTRLSFTILPSNEFQESDSSIMIVLNMTGANIEQEIVVSLSTRDGTAEGPIKISAYNH